MNQLSADCGSWKQLAHEAKKYPSLVAYAGWLQQYEDTPFLSTFCGPVLNVVTRTPERACPVESTRHLIKPHVVELKQTKQTRVWNMLHHPEHGLVVLPASEGLSDLAFDKDWRIIHPNLEEFDVARYDSKFTVGHMDGAMFYLTYLEDKEMDDDSAEFFGDVIRPLYEAEANHAPDADEEEFDETFDSISFLYDNEVEQEAE